MLCISNKTEKKTYYQNSPINQQNSLIKQNDQQKEIEIEAFSLDDLLTLKNFENPDYLNIDTEGNEMDVLEGIDFNKIKPKLVTIEENDFSQISNFKCQKASFMNDRNYALINTIGVTMFFYQKDFLNKISDEIKI